MTPRPALPWPTLCCVCHAWAQARICPDCCHRFAPPRPRCRRCAARVPEGVATCADCSATPPPFVRSTVVADYAFPWHAVIGRLKYHQGLDVADALAGLLAAAVQADGAAQPALVLPMPLGHQRLRERGYNQAAELSRRVARRLALPHAPGLLHRVAETAHQALLSRADRQRAVLGCFAVDAARSHPLRGHVVALVDDVVTTGATAAEAARTLLAAGAHAVQVWAFARTPPPMDA
ncbi:ComF family protein [Aquincola tertiaricarbonis]|uniref:ComF family protein n=1 Tax=Aquincola tertiaricarbonis TaxID=391953 RepID=UPI0006988A7E|nr:ComF family protein [Aquincola tertiaricarbonis]